MFNEKEERAEFLFKNTKCAIVIVDVQNDYCHPNGACMKKGTKVQSLEYMMKHLHRLIAEARKYDIPIIYIQTVHETATDSQVWCNRMGGKTDYICRPNTWGMDYYQLEPRPKEFIVNKHRYSAFVGTKLATDLRTVKIDT